jgi:hypothetical protein
MSIPGVELVGEQHKGMALTSEPLRRRATPPGGRSKLWRQGGRSRRWERHDLAATTLWVGAAGNPVRRVLTNFRAPARPDGSGYGDLPPPSWTPTIPTNLHTLECGPGWVRRPPLNKGSSVDARSMGRGYGRRSGYLTGTRVPDRENTEEMSGENSGAEARAPISSMSICLGPPHLPSR